jgi:hypothetical protein
LAEILLVELLLLLHPSSIFSLLHSLLIADHQSYLANLFSLYSQSCYELFAWLLTTAEAAKSGSIVQ